MEPDCGSFVVEIELQGRMPTSVTARKKESSANEEPAKIADSSQPPSLIRLSAEVCTSSP